MKSAESITTTAPPAAVGWQKRFFTIWTGQVFSLLSSELVQFALIWWLVETSSSAVILSTATMITLLPAAFLNPFIGALVDRWNRRTVMITADALIALSLVWLVVGFAANTIEIWHVFVVMLIRSIGGAFHLPAMLSSTSLMVPKSQLARIAGLNQMLNGIIMVVVPPLGAILLGLIALEGIVAFEIIGACCGILPLLFFRIPQPQKEAAAQTRTTIFVDVREGFRLIRRWRGAVGMLTISTSINFIMRPAFQLIAILVVNHFGGSEVEYGWMGAALGAGFMVGGIVLSVWGGFARKMLTSLVGIIGAGLSILVVGFAPPTAFWLGLAAIFFAGFMMPLCMGPIQALVQSSVEPALQGRIFTIMNSASTLISPLSVLIAGRIFDALGPLVWYRWGGVLAALIGIAGLCTPLVLNLGRPVEE